MKRFLLFVLVAGLTFWPCTPQKGIIPIKLPKLEKMQNLEKETLYNEIIFVFGQLDEDLGSGLVIAGYVFEDSKPVLHFFTGDTFQGLWEIKKTGKK